MADWRGYIRKQVLFCLGKSTSLITLLVTRYKSGNEVLKKHILIYHLPHCLRVLAGSGEGFAKIHCSWVVSFEVQVLQIPTYAWLGKWGLALIGTL